MANEEKAVGAAGGTGTTWIDWVEKLAGEELYDRGRLGVKEANLLDYAIQAAMENPADFERIFASALGPGKINPLCPGPAGGLSSLVRNGVYDDWELWLQWSTEGYRVVTESQKGGADQPFKEGQALRVLDLIAGGRRAAPGNANSEVWVQDMFEQAFHKRPKP